MLYPARVTGAALACFAWSALGQAPPAAPTPTAVATANPRPTPAAARFVGTVLDAAQKALPGALVLVRGSEGEAVSARTDAAGAFAIEVKERGPWSLYVDAAGHAPRSIPKQAPGGGLRIALERGLTAHGVVIDGATRQPVTGARVVAAESTRALGATWNAGLGQRSATSDAVGRFRIDGVGRGFLDLTASATGAGGARVRNVRAGERSELLVLLPMGALEGLVVDAAGQPVAAAAVRVGPTGPTLRPSASTLTTDAEGHFVIDALEPGSWRAIARAEKYAPAWATVNVERDATASVQLRVAPPRAIHGRVVDERERPVAGGRVTWLEHDGEPVPDALGAAIVATLGADGAFALRGLPPGRHRIEAWARGFVPERFEITVGRTDADAGDVRLARGLTVRGVVHGPDGRPVADARVFADRGLQPFPGETAETRSEADGRFVLPGLTPGTLKIVAIADGLGRGSASAETGAEDVVLTLKAWGAIRGTVVDERGQPISPFRVSARAADVFSGRFEEIADASGAFELPAIEAGSYTLEVRAPGRVRLSLPAVNVSSGGVTDVGSLVLKGGGSVVGHVVDKAGEPIAGAEVAGRQGQRIILGDEAAAVSDAAGGFALNGFAAGPVQVTASHPLYAPANVSVAVDPAEGPTDATLMLTTGGRIEGRLAKRDGTPVTTGRINVMPLGGGGGLSLLEPDADGRFVAERVPPGRVRVTWLKGEGGRLESAQTREVEVADGQTATVELLSAEIRVSGRVTRGGQPVPGIRVQLSGQQSMRLMFVTDGRGRGAAGGAAEPGVTREDGSYETTVDQPGPARVSLMSQDGRTTYPGREVQVPDVEAHVLDLTLPGAIVRGSVVDPEGRPLEAQLIASQKDSRVGPGASARTGPDGRFELGLEPGDWSLTARAQGYSAAPLPLSVSESGLDDVRLVLSPGRALRARVVDANGRGVAGANVGVHAPGVLQPIVESGPEGRFEIASVPDAELTLWASTALGSFALRTSVRPGDEEIVLRLRPGARLRVRVVGEDGAPVASAFVAPRFAGGPMVQPTQATTTDSSGVMELRVPAGFGPIEVFASGPGAAATGSIKLAPAEGQELEAEIVLKPPVAAPRPTPSAV